MNFKNIHLRSPGVMPALLAAVLFGAATPLAKVLLAHTSPWMLAALLYLGSGLGLALWRGLRGLHRPQMAQSELKWLLGATAFGGVVGPTCLMWGLANLPAANASLLLNAESVFTALLAWFVFRENFDARIALGMAAILAGAVVLSWPGTGTIHAAALWPTTAVLAACLAWGIDNNLTRKVSLTDASYIAMVKGGVAGTANLVLALVAGAEWPSPFTILSAGVLGFASYGVSLVLFVVALRDLGTARTGAYFAVAPFFGALLATLVLGETLSQRLLLAGGLMALGVWLHLTERHAHPHNHTAMAHTHTHVHGDDPHHDHDHSHFPSNPMPPGTQHSHPHEHVTLRHTHAHTPDAHHRHKHGTKH